MVRAGRKPQGGKLIDRVSGDDSCKARVRAFLETMTGHCTVAEAGRVCGKRGPRWLRARKAT